MSKEAPRTGDDEEIIEPLDELVAKTGGGRSVEAFVKHLLSVQSFFFYVSLELAASKSPRTSRQKGRR